MKWEKAKFTAPAIAGGLLSTVGLPMQNEWLAASGWFAVAVSWAFFAWYLAQEH